MDQADPSLAPYPVDDEYAEYAEYDEPAPDYDQYADDQYADDQYADDQYADDQYADFDEYEEPRYRVISPFRLMLVLLIAAAGAVAFFGIVIQPQLPLAVSGLGVMGVALGLLAFSLAGAAAALGRRGQGGRSLLAALFGGICALAGAGALSAAIVLGLLAAGTA
jgi:hypothetical protein